MVPVACLHWHHYRRQWGECSPLQGSLLADILQGALLDRHSQTDRDEELAPLAASSLELLRPGLTDPLDRVEVFGRDESPEIELLRLREYFR